MYCIYIKKLVFDWIKCVALWKLYTFFVIFLSKHGMAIIEGLMNKCNQVLIAKTAYIIRFLPYGHYKYNFRIRLSGFCL